MTGAIHLKREIGLFGATALGIGAIIGSGIFIVTGIVAGIAGPAMVLSIILAGAIALLSAMSVAESAGASRSRGGHTRLPAISSRRTPGSSPDGYGSFRISLSGQQSHSGLPNISSRSFPGCRLNWSQYPYALSSFLSTISA